VVSVVTEFVTPETGEKTCLIEVECVETRDNGLSLLVDKNGNEFGTFDKGHAADFDKRPEKFEGKKVLVTYFCSETGYLRVKKLEWSNDSDEDVLNKRLVPLTGQEASISRDSARHDAARVVSSIVESVGMDLDLSGSGLTSEEDRTRIKQEIRYWQEFFQHHSRTGNWQ